jgi:peptidoglycan/xylan/chitin deacetylase (PgdA/CDA1 family)
VSVRAGQPPALLVGIDTESDNQWDAAARAQPTFENLYALPTLHALFRDHGVRPTYVITHPVARDPKSADVLRALRESGTCEIGAHHHAWETPPSTPDDVRRHPYALQLPIEQFEAQLAVLTDAITDAVGERPVSYRSGRFGFAAEHVSALERAGYTIDSSIAPLFYESHKGGPDFVDAPLTPYFLAYDHATRPGSSQVLELPISSALNRRVPDALAHAYARAPKPYTTKRVLKKLGVAHVVWLRPSYSTLDEMIALARRLSEAGQPLLNLLFHSSEAIVGGSPYNQTQSDLAAFRDRLTRFLTYAARELHAVPMTFREFRTAWLAQPGQSAALVAPHLAGVAASADAEPDESAASTVAKPRESAGAQPGDSAAAATTLGRLAASAEAQSGESAGAQPGDSAAAATQLGRLTASADAQSGESMPPAAVQDKSAPSATQPDEHAPSAAAGGEGPGPSKNSSPLSARRGEGQG